MRSVVTPEGSFTHVICFNPVHLHAPHTIVGQFSCHHVSTLLPECKISNVAIYSENNRTFLGRILPKVRVKPSHGFYYRAVLFARVRDTVMVREMTDAVAYLNRVISTFYINHQEDSAYDWVLKKPARIYGHPTNDPALLDEGCTGLCDKARLGLTNRNIDECCVCIKLAQDKWNFEDHRLQDME